MVVVVALLGILVALGAAAWGAGRGAHVDAAADLARRIGSIRWDAVVTGRVGPCLPRDLPGGPPDDVRSIWPVRGLSFTADGLPRTCAGGGVGNATILLEHRGQQAAVIVSALGRVRWERR